MTTTHNNELHTYTRTNALIEGYKVEKIEMSNIDELSINKGTFVDCVLTLVTGDGCYGSHSLSIDDLKKINRKISLFLTEIKQSEDRKDEA